MTKLDQLGFTDFKEVKIPYSSFESTYTSAVTPAGQLVKVGSDMTSFYDIEDLTPPVDALIWKGSGYSGGHVSQRDWRHGTSQEVHEMRSLILKGYKVKDLTVWGQTGGYYPEVAYWK